MSLRKEIVLEVKEIGLGQVRTTLEGASDAFGDFKANVDLNSIALKSYLDRLKSFSRNQKDNVQLFNEYDKILKQVTQTTSRNRAQTDRLIETYRTTGEFTNKQITEAKRLVESNYEIAQSEAVTMMATDRRYAGQIQANQAIRSATSGGRILAQVLEEITGETHKAAGGTAKFSGALGGVSGNMARSNKSLASSNQLLFSFSDLVQDSTQFSQGFATGMRAIGNNIGFTMELFASVNNHVKEFNRLNKEAIATGSEQAKTVKGELAQSLKGFGGALAVNAIVMISTVALQAYEKRMKELADRGKENVDVYNEVSKAFSQLSSEFKDPLGVRSAEAQIEILTDAYKSFNKETLESHVLQKASENGLIKLGTVGLAAQAAISGIATATGILNPELKINSETYKQLRVEAEKAQLKQEAFTAYLNKEQNRGLKNAVDLLKRLSQENSKYGATIERTATLSRFNRDEIAQQISAIRQKTNLEESDVLALDALSDAYAKLSSNVKTALDLQRKENDVMNEGAALRVQAIQQNAERGTSRQKLDAAIQQNLYNASLEIEQIRREKEDRQQELLTLLDLGLISDEVYSRRIQRVNDLAIQQTRAAHETQAFEDRQAELNKVISDAGVVQSLAQTTALLGDVFGASKEMQIAMAVIDGGAAIVKTFAQLGFPAGIPASLAVAAKTAQTIAQMKNVQPGDSTPIGGAGGGGSSRGISVTDVGGNLATATPFGQPNYLPSDRDTGRTPIFYNEVLATDEELYIITRNGEERIASSQV